MKKVRFGDVIEGVQENAVILHGCNDRGVMGSGIALQIKRTYPGAFAAYAEVSNESAPYPMELGTIVPYQAAFFDNLHIVNGITQAGFGADGRRYVNYAAVEKVFRETAMYILAKSAEAGEPLSLHYPLIGAGLGGGEWAVISDIIDSTMSDYPQIDHTLWIFERLP